jgi:hypothetical protein
LRAVAKFEPAAHKAYFIGLAVDPIMEPPGVGACVRKKYNERSAE